MWRLRKLPCKQAFFFSLLIFSAMIAAASCDSGSAGAKTNAAEKAPAFAAAPLPAAGEAAGWAPSGEPKTFAGEGLFEHIDGGADIYFEYGFDGLCVQQYNNEDKAVSLEIYRMSDPAAAFGIYSYSRHPSLSPVEVGTDATIHPNGLFFWQDIYYVNMRQLGAAPVSPEEFMALAKAVSGKIKSTEDKPGIMSLLPDEKKVANTEVFARGRLAIDNQVYVADDNLFALKKGEAAAIARYRIGQPEFSVVIADYASNEASEEAFTRFRTHFLGSAGAGEKNFTVSAMPGKHDAVGIVGKRLIVVANADSGEKAHAMLDKITDAIADR